MEKSILEDDNHCSNLIRGGLRLFTNICN
jgi:hypothetical protein